MVIIGTKMYCIGRDICWFKEIGIINLTPIIWGLRIDLLKNVGEDKFLYKFLAFQISLHDWLWLTGVGKKRLLGRPLIPLYWQIQSLLTKGDAPFRHSDSHDTRPLQLTINDKWIWLTINIKLLPNILLSISMSGGLSCGWLIIYRWRTVNTKKKRERANHRLLLIDRCR